MAEHFTWKGGGARVWPGLLHELCRPTAVTQHICDCNTPKSKVMMSDHSASDKPDAYIDIGSVLQVIYNLHMHEYLVSA